MTDLRRGGRARLKASDSKSDRGVSPSGVQILSPPPILRPWRGDRAAEGAALEMPCTGDPCAAGSNPAPSARFAVGALPRPTVGESMVEQSFDVAVLDGELAVPCNPQSASAGLNSHSEGGPC